MTTTGHIFLTFLCAIFVASCGKPLDDGYAVDITVKAIDSLAPSTVASVQSLDFTVRGAERANVSFPITRAFTTQRRETVIYRPLVSSGDLDFIVRARDGSGAIVGYAESKLSLVAKHTVPLTLSLSGDLPPAILDADPQRDFGTVLVGQSSGPQVLTVTNIGGMPSAPLTVALSGDDAAAFVVQTDLCSGNALEAGASCAVTLQATPTHAGALTALLTATATPGGTVEIALSASSQEPGALKADPLSHNFGQAVVGQSADASVFTISNSGAVALGPLTPSVTGSAAAAFPIGPENCTGATLQPGATCTVSVSFKPSSDGLVSASLQVTDGANTPAVANVQGTGLSPSRLQATPTMPDFGSIVVGSTLDLTVTVKNVGGAATGALASMLGGGDAGQFSLVTDGCAGQPLAAGASCAVAIRFAPTSAGGKSATLTVTGTPGGSVSSMLMGTALKPGALSISSPLNGDFGTLLVATKSPVQTFTVTNSGGASTGSLMVMLSGSDAGQFKLTADGCSGNSLGGGGTCQVNVQFAPDSAGNKSAALNVSANPGGNASSVLVGVAQRPAVLQASPGTNANLGTSTVGVAGSMTTFTISNGGDQPTTTLSTTTGGAIGDFVITDNCAGHTLGASCTIIAQLKPTSYGQKNATLTVAATTGGSVQLNLSGVGQDTVTLTLTTPGSGGGTLSASGQTSCTTGPCTWTFTRNASIPSVTINATPDGTSDFTGWGGDCAANGTAASCTLSMSVNRPASATFTRRKVTLTVQKPVVDAGAGTVTSNVGGVSCGATCTVSIDAGTNVTLTAAPTSGVFQGWFGDCSGDQTTCTVKMDAARTVGASFLHTKYNFVFTTSQKWDGALGGLSGADAKCQSAATTAGLHGTYKAYLAASSGPVTTISRLGSARGWVRRDGRPFADLTSDLVSPNYKIYYPPKLDEYGHDSVYGAYTFVGSDGQGNPAYNMGVPYTCTDWTSNAMVPQAYGGHSSASIGGWSGGYNQYCSTPESLLCFQTDVTATLTFTKATGRTAFVSQAAFDPSTGVTGADNLCKSEATTAGLSGSYLALIGTSTMPASSRFSSVLAPWVNVNGVAVSEKAVDLFTPNSTLLAGLSLTATGGWGGNVAANGSNDPTKVGTNTCKDWTSKASGDSGDVGAPSEGSWPLFFGGLSWDCATIATFGHVYCLQQ